MGVIPSQCEGVLRRTCARRRARASTAGRDYRRIVSTRIAVINQFDFLEREREERRLS